MIVKVTNIGFRINYNGVSCVKEKIDIMKNETEPNNVLECFETESNNVSELNCFLQTCQPCTVTKLEILAKILKKLEIQQKNWIFSGPLPL